MTPLDHGEALESYVADHTTAPPAHLEALERETRESLAFPQMLTGRVEGRLLETLVHITRPRLILELGTYSGYSALSMAAALPEGGRIVTCEVSDEHADFAQRHVDASGLADRISIRRGPALETIAGLDAPFDLVFVDADKPGYSDYYEAVVPKLAPHGLIVADNTLWSGRVADPSEDDDTTRAMREFNDRVRDDPRTVSVMLTVRDGITLIRLAG
ncbi:MAG TPA: O-methyltransferase [Solirubrobacteraceae bacterium]|nr:O-methyltransferase [Solirubrobacteraceae bacterium]